MANKKKTNNKPGRGGRLALGIFAAVLLALVATAGIGFLNASLLRIRRAEVVLSDLPVSFDGTTLLYASDIDLCGLNTPARAGLLFNQLQSLQPDMLVLGGDYNASALLDKLNRPERNSADEAKALASRSDFFQYIKAFHAPLGKFAIAATEDLQWQALRSVLEENDIHPLINGKTEIQNGTDRIWLVGICGKLSSLNDAASAFKQKDCVITIAEGPDILPVLLTSEASDSGPWADLALCGHTHGGQIRLFGRSILSLSDADKRFLTGWNTGSGIPILTTQGVGCEGLNIRIGTEPEVWLITLRKG